MELNFFHPKSTLRHWAFRYPLILEMFMAYGSNMLQHVNTGDFVVEKPTYHSHVGVHPIGICLPRISMNILEYPSSPTGRGSRGGRV